MCGSACLNRLHGPRSRDFAVLRDFSGLGNFSGLGLLRLAAIVPRSLPAALLDRRFRDLGFLGLRFRLLRFRAAAAGDIFLAVDRRDVGRIPVEIGPPDSKVLAVFVDPLPELFGGDPSLRAARCP